MGGWIEGKERAKKKTKKRERNCEKKEVSADHCPLGRDVMGPV
jgi:hypothetical protein